MKEKRNVEKQEEVVAALWDFAADLQLRSEEGCVATCASGPNTGTKCSLDHVGRACTRIMATFGYTKTEIH